MNQIIGIQYLRALAAMLVIFHHSGSELNFTFFGAEGVDIFFVISGYIMAMITQKNTDESKYKQISTFFKKRFIRIVPLYWIMLLWTYKLQFTNNGMLRNLIYDMLFIPRIHSTGLIWPQLVVGWTLNYEMFFYAIIGISLFFNQKRYYIVFLIIISLSLLGIVSTQTHAFTIFYSSSILVEFLLGIVLFFASKKIRLESNVGNALLTLTSLALMMIPTTLPRLISDGIPAMILVFAVINLSRNTHFKTLKLLGDASYSTYLCHLSLFSVSGKVLALFNFSFMELPTWVAIPILMLIATIGGLAVYFLIEKPLLNYMSNRMRKPV